MRHLGAPIALALLTGLLAHASDARAQGQPDGQLTIAFDVSIAPALLEPAETAGIGTPHVFLYALHDALAKPLPGNDMAAIRSRPRT
jgi:peptide/nickel transport system substrate-binding protein